MTDESFLAGCTPWPSDFAARYRREGCWQDETLGHVLSRKAQQSAERVALIDAGAQITYAELERRASALAHGLLELGIGSNDRVVVQLPNGATWYEVCFGLWKLGAIPVLAHPAHRAHEIGAFVEQSQAKAYVIADSFERFDYRELALVVRNRTNLEHVIVSGEPGAFTPLASLYSTHDDAPLPDVDPSQVALMQLSGGSTGIPKLIPRTHNDYLYSVRQSVAVCGWNEQVVYAVALPCAHNFPLSSPGALGALLAGGTVLSLPNPAPSSAFPFMIRHGATAVSLVPSLAQLWCNASVPGSPSLTLHSLQVGGAKLDTATAQRLWNFSGQTLQQVFGMAEGLVNYTRRDDPLELVLSTQGRPMSPHDEVLVVDDEDRPLPNGHVGHLLTRGPYTIRGYYRADEHNSLAFTRDGFYRTGDLVRRLDTGHLVVEGRAKDQVNRGGEKIAAQEVEGLLKQTGLVTDAALVAVPDAFLGEKSCAFVCGPNPEVSRESILNSLREFGVAAYKLPDRVVWLPELPRTPIGKVNKPALQKHPLISR